MIPQCYSGSISTRNRSSKIGIMADSEQSTIDEKIASLREIVRNTGGLAIAFSGGVDSTLLAAIAHEELGDSAIAVTAHSPTYPEREQNEANELAKQIGIRHIVVDSNELHIPGFSDNPPDRCYHCKSELFTVVGQIAKDNGIKFVADGTNADDLNDYRPGRRASKELGVLAPLLEANMTKDDIRECSRRLALPTAEKPAFACLASRFPYGSTITEDKLTAVDAMENGLRDLGFNQLRVRHHGQVARIEVPADDIERIATLTIRRQVVELAKNAGFTYVSLDLEGYRTGSMNEDLDTEPKSV